MACEEQKSTTRGKVVCRDFLVHVDFALLWWGEIQSSERSIERMFRDICQEHCNIIVRRLSKIHLYIYSYIFRFHTLSNDILNKL